MISVTKLQRRDRFCIYIYVVIVKGGCLSPARALSLARFLFHSFSLTLILTRTLTITLALPLQLVPNRAGAHPGYAEKEIFLESQSLSGWNHFNK